MFWHLLGNSHSSGPLSFGALVFCSTNVSRLLPLPSLSVFVSAPSPGFPPTHPHPDPRLAESPKVS